MQHEEDEVVADDMGGVIPTSVVDWKNDLLREALERHALRFGKFTLKSGRQSPYFFNSGKFDDGASFSALCSAYTQGILEGLANNTLPEFDVLYGPAYKGIPLVVGVAMQLASVHKLNYSFIYNRKEVKDHGEGGSIVGMSPLALMGQRVLLIDDVLTAGTAVGEAIGALHNHAAAHNISPSPVVVGVVIALDRQERCGAAVIESAASLAPDDERLLSTVALVERQHKVKVVSLVTFHDLLHYVEISDQAPLMDSMRAYRTTYGAKLN